MEKDKSNESSFVLDASLRQWFDTPPGSVLLKQESSALESVLSHVFGHYLVQVGFPGLDRGAVNCSSVKYHVMVTPGTPDGSPAGWIRAAPSKLPIATDSIDVLLLQHTLDFSSDPHQVLRESDRVLIPEGRLIIAGFNPWSLWGGWRFFRRRSRRVPWCGNFLSPGRLHDWLSLLGFEVESTMPLMFRPPLGQNLLLNRLSLIEKVGSRWWPIMSGVYLLVAVKRVSTLTPMRPAWQIPANLLGGRAIEPTARNGHG